MAALVTLAGLGLGGCASGGIEMVTTIAGGQTIHVPMGRGGAELVKEGGVQINVANIMQSTDKKIVYVFSFTDTQKRALRNVRVDDVSDEKPVMLLDSAEPKLSDIGLWQSESEKLSWGDGRLSWLATISNSLRVFRFTLTFADGQTLVLNQGTLFPPPMKAAVRHAFGENY